jgi:uncharacterized phage protein (TIGR01671 family)
MKREIKFKGKDFLGRWHYGHLHLATGSSSLMIQVDSFDSFGVLPETVGQFTGLLDGNGQEIFEGDIMRIPETEFNIEIIGVVEFDRGSYVVRSFFSGTRSSLAWAVRGRQSGGRRGVVIGNIHDKPELLKGGAE